MVTGARKIKTGERYSEIVYYTCQTCNGGWMSAVVNAAKPEVIKLVEGDWSLTPNGQGRLSRWIALVTTSISYFCGPAGVAEHHRRCMKEAAHLDGWRIWVAALANADHGGRMRHVAISGGDQQGGQPPTQIVAFTVENVGFLVAHSLGEQTLDLGQYYGLTLAAPAEAGLLPILPPSDAASPATITYSQFLQLVDVVAGVN
ncbi:hypothetical protein DMC25_13865 [Caulobacter sp. D4A]|nr:hypothetical protein DMC25_13865 [Caulobacter sp. D4A]PXA89864.1 hypothetical protein DMC18_15875 [Caulobacter sp. D5]